MLASVMAESSTSAQRRDGERRATLNLPVVTIRQWTRDGEPVGRPWTSDGRPVDLMAMSPDESMVVSGSADGRLRLWNIKRGSMVGNPWEGHDDAVLCLDWSSNAQEVASGSKDGTIRRWSPDTGREIAPPIETGRGRVWAVRYPPQGDKFASSGEDKVIRVWSKIGELLMEIKGHEREVMSLCWSKDGANIFSASYDDTIRKLRSIDGKELVVFQGHTNSVHSLCLSPDESHLVTAAADCSVRIWDLETNRPVGNPLLHDDEIFAVVISPDGKYIANAGLDGKIYVWSLDAVLKHIGDDHSADESNTKPNAKLKGCAARPRDAILHVGQVSKQQHDNKLRDLARYGKDFWDADTNTGPRSTAPPARPLSSLWRNLLGSLRFGTRPPNAPQSILLEPRRWNFNLFSGGSSITTVEVAAGRKKNNFRFPPTAAEVARAEAAAAMQRPNGNEAGSSTQAGQPRAVSESQGRLTQMQDAGGGAGDVSYEGVNCCGLFFGRRRSTSHQS